MRFTGTQTRRRARPSLTPMIDVVFLLLVFFMLAARFGTDAALALSPSGSGAVAWQGAPRLVEFDGTTVYLNGSVTPLDALADTLADLMPAPDAPVLLRGRDAATLGDLTAVMDVLRAGGITSLMVVE